MKEANIILLVVLVWKQIWKGELTCSWFHHELVALLGTEPLSLESQSWCFNKSPSMLTQGAWNLSWKWSRLSKYLASVKLGWKLHKDTSPRYFSTSTCRPSQKQEAQRVLWKWNDKSWPSLFQTSENVQTSGFVRISDEGSGQLFFFFNPKPKRFGEDLDFWVLLHPTFSISHRVN